jgi:hypothetical protein
MRASRLLRRYAVLALLFALSGVGHLPERRVASAEVAPVTAVQPRRAQPAPRPTRAIANANAVAAPVSYPSPPPATAPRERRSRFVSRLYLRHRALLI